MDWSEQRLAAPAKLIHRIARVTMVIYLIFGCGAAAYMLARLGLIPTSPLTSHGMALSIILSCSLLGYYKFGLALKTYQQRLAETQIKVLSLQKRVNSDLRRKVDCRTRELETQMRKALASERTAQRAQQQAEQALRELEQRLVHQTRILERSALLQRYLPPELVHWLLDQNQTPDQRQQRRQVTVFAIELKGFDQATAALEAEQQAEMLSQYLAAALDLSTLYQATVNSPFHNLVVGFIGAPQSAGPHKDALRCVKLCLALWQRFKEISAAWMADLSAAQPTPVIAIASGYATVGDFGSPQRLEYMAAGRPLVEAKAILRAICGGGVVCGQATWALLQHQIDGDSQGEIAIPAHSQPLRIYRLAGDGAVPPPSTPDSLSIDHQAVLQTLPARRLPCTGAVSRPSAESALQVHQLQPGMVLAERYKIIKGLGAGGMGRVYQAWDLKLELPVALKLTRSHIKHDPDHRLRLQKEVKMARLVSHPNVARIFDFCEWRGYEFISMEYIEGQDLTHRLAEKQPIALAEGQVLLLQLCQGLAAAHQAGVVHCDLKPSNVMLEEGGRVVILDFGIARWQSSLRHKITSVLPVLGTPGYMAPEQLTAGEIDQRTDIYTLGLVACEIFTRRSPYEPDPSVRIAIQHHLLTVNALNEQLAGLPPLIAEIIGRCLEEDPAQRFSSVEQILALLDPPPKAAASLVAPQAMINP